MYVNLKVELARRGWSQTKLAEESGISRVNLCRILNGQRKISLYNAMRIKEALGTDLQLEELFKDEVVE
jgi:plasmid maintenance system antidote protein VapI